MAHVNTDWLAECWARGCLEDLSGRTRSDPPEDYPAGWPTSLLGLQTFPDGLAGIPFHDGPECLIYRKDLFDSETGAEVYRARYGCRAGAAQDLGGVQAHRGLLRAPRRGPPRHALRPVPGRAQQRLRLRPAGPQPGRQPGAGRPRRPRLAGGARRPAGLPRSHQQPVHPPGEQAARVHRRLLDLRPRRGGHDGELVRLRNDVRDGRGLQGARPRRHLRRPPRRLAPRPGVAQRLLRLVHRSPTASTRTSPTSTSGTASAKENDVILTMEGGIGCRRSTWFDPQVNRVIPYYSRMAEIHGYASTLPRSARLARHQQRHRRAGHRHHRHRPPGRRHPAGGAGQGGRDRGITGQTLGVNGGQSMR